MNDEANRLIAEEPNALIGKAINWKHWSNNYTDKLWRPVIADDHGMRLVDFCGNDHDALDAIKELALPGREINVQHNIICGEHSLRFFKGKRGEECQVPFYDELSEGRGKTLAAALKDAMVEIIKVGCERAPACPGACDPCEKATANIRIRPAVEAAVKGGE